jgi:ribose-phosphate pyrophosphokinase
MNNSMNLLFQDAIFISGSSHRALAEEIVQLLGTKLVESGLKKFSNGEIYCEIQESLRGRNVFIIQSTSAPANENLMELLICIDAIKRAQAHSITAVIPHFGYSRQDRKTAPRSPITAKLVADLLHVAGVTRVMTLELHSGQIQGFFNIPVDNLSAGIIFSKYLKEHFALELQDTKTSIVVSPDCGGVYRSRQFAALLYSSQPQIAFIDKERLDQQQVRSEWVIGNVEGKLCILYDDIIDSGKTINQAAKVLMDAGAKKIWVIATHAIFSRDAKTLLLENSSIHKIFILNTIASEDKKDADSSIQNLNSKLHFLSCAPLIAKAIERTLSHQSISQLFCEDSSV